MRSLVIGLLLCSLVTPALRAQDCETELAALRAFYDIRDLAVRESTSPYDITRRIDQHLSELREPLGDGSFRWVNYVRPTGSAPIVKRERSVEANRDAGDSEIFEAGADHPFAVQVVVPRKRSLIRGNMEAWVGEVEIRYWADGEEDRITRTINAWLRPDTTRSFDLGVIADRAEVVAEVGTRKSTPGQSLVEIHFQQAVPQDDPESPNADTVRRLKSLAADADPGTIDDEIESLEQQIFGRSGRLRTTELVATLRAAETLLASEKEEEREKGQKLLDTAFLMLPR